MTTDKPQPRTREEIDDLKAAWIHDPCWDIEETEGFEFHYQELLQYRKQQEAEWLVKESDRDQARHQLVMEQTGVTDFDITNAISTFSEIERNVERLAQREVNYEVDATINLVRATLLQAAQLKRIADALEDMTHGSVIVSAKGE